MTSRPAEPHAPMMMSCFVGNGASLGSGAMVAILKLDGSRGRETAHGRGSWGSRFCERHGESGGELIKALLEASAGRPTT
jgi:hypothetical protein